MDICFDTLSSNMSFSLDQLPCVVPLSPERRIQRSDSRHKAASPYKLDAIAVHVVSTIARRLCTYAVHDGKDEACAILQNSDVPFISNRKSNGFSPHSHDHVYNIAVSSCAPHERDRLADPVSSSHRSMVNSEASCICTTSEESTNMIVERLGVMISKVAVEDAVRYLCMSGDNDIILPSPSQDKDVFDQLSQGTTEKRVLYMQPVSENLAVSKPCVDAHKLASDETDTRTSRMVSWDPGSPNATAGTNDIEIGINHLPVEILVVIFRLSSTHLEILQVLSQVCTYWLAVCQSLVGYRIDLSDPTTARYVTDSLMFSLRRFSLESVDISNCTEVSEAGIYALSCLKLKKLIARNLNLFTLSIIHLGTCFQELDEIDLSGTQAISRGVRMDKYTAHQPARIVRVGGLHFMLKNYPKVEEVSLESDTQSLDVLESCKQLRALKLSQCSLWKRTITRLNAVESLELVEVYIHTNRFFPPRPSWTGARHYYLYFALRVSYAFLTPGLWRQSRIRKYLFYSHIVSVHLEGNLFHPFSSTK